MAWNVDLTRDLGRLEWPVIRTTSHNSADRWYLRHPSAYNAYKLGALVQAAQES